METFWAHDAGVLVLVHGEGHELVAGNAVGLVLDHELAVGHAGGLGADGPGHGDGHELVAGDDHELVTGHAGGLGVLGPGHGDDHELVACHAGGLGAGLGPGHGDDRVLAVYGGKGEVSWCWGSQR